MRDLSFSHLSSAARARRGSPFDWVRSGVLAGFIATFGMTVSITIGYLLANVIGSADGSRIERWFWPSRRMN